METLRKKYIRLLNATDTTFKRYLFNELDWNSRLVILKGQRGVGKSTLILQHIKESFTNYGETLYVTLDDIYFAKNSLSTFVEEFTQLGGRYLFIDEVHRYKNWSVELKNIYDFYPELKIVATGSSALEINKAKADLSRRASVYHLHELSVREYHNLMFGTTLPVLSLTDVLEKHEQVAMEINRQIKPVKVFREYMEQGAYPFVREKDALFYAKLKDVVNIIIENDLPAVENISYETTYKLKKLLMIITDSVPFTINVAELSRKLNTSRDMLLRYIYLLSAAGLINTLSRHGKSTSGLRKPDKIYLNNTTLMHSLNENPNLGTLRETFFLNQLAAQHTITYPKQGDFLVDNKYLFEIGGKNKTNEQIKDAENAFIAADDIEYGFGNKIPLWLFGFLY
ncbi:MAG: AAA family ATPase [Salinivirgaceae bacterium]|jgi:predicted AAA+ superfamily ATPase|nr:AAA family ATPase [Salinivirgaceae bacterium]